MNKILVERAERTYTLAMERGLALALFVLMSMGIVTVKLLGRSGVMESRPEWHRYLEAHTTLWLMLVPFVYAALCEVARGRESSPLILIITRVLGVLLLVVIGLLLASLIFNF